MHAGDGIYSKMASQPLYKENVADTELEHKARKVSDKFSETINVIANEPSLAFYRIQEHVRKTLPQLVDQKHEMEDMQEKVKGSCFDAEYATNAVRAMQSSAIHFQNIQDLLKNAMFMKQQISYEENRRKVGRTSASPVPSSSSDQIDSVSREVQASPSSQAGLQQPNTTQLSDDPETSQEVEKLMASPSYVSATK